ncbi:MAG: hypothetical protein U0L19_03470 [Bacteroidales bacterium]|nr:hypothetical protein [Bacteroidales bacterium]
MARNSTEWRVENFVSLQCQRTGESARGVQLEGISNKTRRRLEGNIQLQGGILTAIVL